MGGLGPASGTASVPPVRSRVLTPCHRRKPSRLPCTVIGSCISPDRKVSTRLDNPEPACICQRVTHFVHICTCRIETSNANVADRCRQSVGSDFAYPSFQGLVARSIVCQRNSAMSEHTIVYHCCTHRSEPLQMENAERGSACNHKV